MTAEQVVLAVAGTLAIVASLVAVATTRPVPRSLIEVLYLVVPPLGVILLVAAAARAL